MLEERIRRQEDVVASLNPTPAVDISPANPTPEPAPQPYPPATTRPLFPLSGGWLLFEIYAELRAILRMIFDPRYSLTWQTRLLAPLLIAGIVFLKLVLGAIPLVGGILESVFYPVLLYMLFKVLSREATRYRMTSPDLPPALRL
jgi:hypothetical protein